VCLPYVCFTVWYCVLVVRGQLSWLLHLCKHFKKSRDLLCNTKDLHIHKRKIRFYKSAWMSSICGYPLEICLKRKREVGEDPRTRLGRSPPPHSLFSMIFYNSQNSIREIKPFSVHYFVAAVLLSILHRSYSNEPAMRLTTKYY